MSHEFSVIKDYLRWWVETSFGVVLIKTNDHILTIRMYGGIPNLVLFDIEETNTGGVDEIVVKLYKSDTLVRSKKLFKEVRCTNNAGTNVEDLLKFVESVKTQFVRLTDDYHDEYFETENTASEVFKTMYEKYQQSSQPSGDTWHDLNKSIMIRIYNTVYQRFPNTPLEIKPHFNDAYPSLSMGLLKYPYKTIFCEMLFLKDSFHLATLSYARSDSKFKLQLFRRSGELALDELYAYDGNMERTLVGLIAKHIPDVYEEGKTAQTSMPRNQLHWNAIHRLASIVESLVSTGPPA